MYEPRISVKGRFAALPPTGSRRPMLLKKSVPSCSARFSWVVSPPTKTHERLVGRSERLKFSPAARQQHAATFSTTSRRNGHSCSRVGRQSGCRFDRRL